MSSQAQAPEHTLATFLQNMSHEMKTVESSIAKSLRSSDHSCGLVCVAVGSLGLGCGRLRCLFPSAARRPLPSANSAVEGCLLCVLCKLGSEAFWPAKHIHCRRAAASAAAAFVSLVLHTCLSCTYLHHAARSHAVLVPYVSALITMLSPLRFSGSQAFFGCYLFPLWYHESFWQRPDSKQKRTFRNIRSN